MQKICRPKGAAVADAVEIRMTDPESPVRSVGWGARAKDGVDARARVSARTAPETKDAIRIIGGSPQTGAHKRVLQTPAAPPKLSAGNHPDTRPFQTCRLFDYNLMQMEKIGICLLRLNSMRSWRLTRCNRSAHGPKIWVLRVFDVLTF